MGDWRLEIGVPQSPISFMNSRLRHPAKIEDLVKLLRRQQSPLQDNLPDRLTRLQIFLGNFGGSQIADVRIEHGDHACAILGVVLTSFGICGQSFDAELDENVYRCM